MSKKKDNIKFVGSTFSSKLLSVVSEVECGRVFSGHVLRGARDLLFTQT